MSHGIGKTQRRILEVLDRHPEGMDWKEVSALVYPRAWGKSTDASADKATQRALLSLLTRGLVRAEMGTRRTVGSERRVATDYPTRIYFPVNEVRP